MYYSKFTLKSRDKFENWYFTRDYWQILEETKNNFFTSFILRVSITHVKIYCWFTLMADRTKKNNNEKIKKKCWTITRRTFPRLVISFSTEGNYTRSIIWKQCPMTVIVWWFNAYNGELETWNGLMAKVTYDLSKFRPMNAFWYSVNLLSFLHIYFYYSSFSSIFPSQFHEDGIFK